MNKKHGDEARSQQEEKQSHLIHRIEYPPDSLQVKGCRNLGRLPLRTLGKTSRSRNWNYESSKPHIHRVVDRRAHRIAAGGGGVCKGRRNIRAEIAALGISNS